MNKLIKEAAQYAGMTEPGIKIFRDYYNANAVQFVKKSRQYKMQAGDNWCAMFVSCIWLMAGNKGKDFPIEVSVGEMCKLAEAKGMFTTDKDMVREGDLIVFNWNGDSWPDHIGFVYSIDGGTITTLEGNYHNTVKRRVIRADSKHIFGFINLP